MFPGRSQQGKISVLKIFEIEKCFPIAGEVFAQTNPSFAGEFLSEVIYLEHDPPQQHPTNTRHVVADPSVTIVHVTHFNNLMWDNNGVPTHVIDHGIVSSALEYKGDLKKGIVVP